MRDKFKQKLLFSVRGSRFRVQGSGSGTALDFSSYFMHFFQRCFVHFLLALIFLFLSLDAQRALCSFFVLSLFGQRKNQRKAAGKDNPTLFVRPLHKAILAPPNRVWFAPFPGSPRAFREILWYRYRVDVSFRTVTAGMEDGNKEMTMLTEAPLVAKQREPVPPQAGGRG